jgi:hypothetical protein
VNQLGCEELYFLLDSDGAIVAYQEQDQSWAGALAFSSEQVARKFLKASRLEVAEIAAVNTADQAGLGRLIGALKRRPIRYLLLDLDHETGACQQVDFEGERLGAIRQRKLSVQHPHKPA